MGVWVYIGLSKVYLYHYYLTLLISPYGLRIQSLDIRKKSLRGCFEGKLALNSVD